MSLSARVSVPRAVLRSPSTSIGPYKSSESTILRCSHTEGWKIGRDGAQFTWSATGPDLYLLGRIYSILGIRPRHTGLPGQAFCTACWDHWTSVLSASFIEVSVTRQKPAKNHSANVLSELLVIIFRIFPLLVAVWKRRKSFTVTRSGASTCFLRTRSRTAASLGIGSPSRRASPFISSRCQLKCHVSIDPSPWWRRQRPSHRT
jgi:hypothetical protein